MAGLPGTPAFLQNNSKPNSQVGTDLRHDPTYARGALIVIPYGYKAKTIPSFSGPIPFMINPESIHENLQGGWIHKTVPGQNDPVSSWVGNGTRSVTLTLLVIKDISNYKVPIANLTGGSMPSPSQQTVLGQIGATLAKIPLPLLQNLSPNEPAQVQSTATNPINIAIELDQLRNLRYGELYKNHLYSTPPSLVKFNFYQVSGSASNSGKNPTLGVSGLQDVYWTVDSVEITTTKWAKDLQPLEAEVKLTLVQFNDINRSRT
jgi:hypothetical protein